MVEMLNMKLEHPLPAKECPAGFRPAGPSHVDPAMAPHHRRLVEEICRRPEIRPLSASVSFAVTEALPGPFRVLRGSEIRLRPGALANSALAALHIRHALELASWQRRAGGAGLGRLAVGLLALRTAALYHRLMTTRERADCAPHLPGWLHEGLRVMEGDIAPAEPAKWVARSRHLLEPLLDLQGGQSDEAGGESDAGAGTKGLDKVLAEFDALATPTEYLLLTGADDRLHLDPATGLNRYGCSPRPRPGALCFSSSTASSVSEPGYREVEDLRQRLLTAACAGQLPAVLRSETEALKAAVLDLCGVRKQHGAEIILTASGTDAEFYALCLALERPADRVVNILVGPDESGSGVLDAAAGRHFSTFSAAGVTVRKGTPVEGMGELRVRVASIDIRDGQAHPRRVADIDREVSGLAEQAIAEGWRCLIHLLDSSKTGLRAPSLEALRRLQARHPGAADMVVDACQMRADPEALRGYVESGFMVMITASKFFGGPPFAGALIVPRAIAARARRMSPLPVGFSAYTGAPEWPAAWSRLCGDLPQRSNLGLLGRWAAGVAEMRAFATVPTAERRRILRAFARTVMAALAARDSIEPVAVGLPGPGEGGEDGDGQVPTLFPFFVLREGAGDRRVPLGLEEARRVHAWLNMDISALLSQEAAAWEHALAARECHIGQPVAIHKAGGLSGGALRICAGARLVTAVAFDPALGEGPATRLRQALEGVHLVLDKIDLILRHFDRLAARAAACA